MEIIPAIMPEDFYHIEDDVQAVAGHVTTVQLDIMDGKFVDGKTWPFMKKNDVYFDKLQREEAGLPLWEKIDYELDLMIERPENTMEQWLALGPKRIVLHIESLLDPVATLEDLAAVRDIVEVGLSFDDDIEVTELDQYMEMIDFVQVMGIDEVGKQGEPFEVRSLYNVEYLHNKFPDLPISVDGSVNLDTIEKFRAAGATRFVAGSAVYDGAPIENIKNLQSLLQ